MLSGIFPRRNPTLAGIMTWFPAVCTHTIIDKGMIGDFMKKGPGAKLGHLRKWIDQGHGIVVYSEEGGYAGEIAEHPNFLALLSEYRRSDRARLISASRIEKELKRVNALGVKSDDRHILALAGASDARVLCSKDYKLQDDFKNSGILPKVGQKKRSVYPLNGKSSVQREFLSRRRCTG